MKKKTRNKIFSFIRNFIDPLFPKNKKKILLYASTGVLDANLVCVKEYLSYYHSELEVVVFKGKRKRSFQESVKLLCDFFTSYYIIVDHAIPRFLTNNKREIYNVWHGIPLKTIRHFDKDRFTDAFLDFESDNLTGLVCSSNLDKAVMAACFNVAPSKCILSGLPRADLLDFDGLEWFTDPQEEELVSALAGRKLVSWMPTYRGTWKEFNEINAFSRDEEVLLCKFLKENNAVLGVRPHKFSKLQALPLLEKNDLLIDLANYTVTNTLLKHTQLLVTDYSSVWLDYSLISSNICLYLFDEADYGGERGMIYPLSEVLTGEISTDFHTLLLSLEKMMDESLNKSTPSPMFFKHKDASNTKRFIEHVLKINA
ncbi:CDP-glycerol glycerophosphotransferase family protein [Vibrio splendidus]|uniref:CDP-glycerol glycerophosphotransferase family protein n=1 Tax=Vibrio splendidus TaxID=29497 RepID=A0ABD5ABF9_VIBSP|nr:CDP-glycerol glycerophosphotransferase family protein [Vibrio splendidus]MCC4881511.1 CDP-glycerol glycerophosphotransferase family protein [Vibrio splendidus]MDP2490257.1 CDP-glycerol glycerophosphotransferase family protein [Vibrio splendidus]